MLLMQMLQSRRYEDEEGKRVEKKTDEGRGYDAPPVGNEPTRALRKWSSSALTKYTGLHLIDVSLPGVTMWLGHSCRLQARHQH